jgi:hypothetical protein
MNFSGVVVEPVAFTLAEVVMLHSLGKYNVAADRLLAFVDGRVDNSEYVALNYLLKQLAQLLRTDAQLFGSDRGHAIFLNVLAMTRPIMDSVDERDLLLAAFRSFLQETRDSAYADRLLAKI